MKAKNALLCTVVKNIVSEYQAIATQQKALPALSSNLLVALGQGFCRGSKEGARLYFAPLTGLIKAVFFRK